MVKQHRLRRRVKRPRIQPSRSSGKATARRQGPERAVQRVDCLGLVEIAEQLDLDRTLAEDRLPDLAEALDRRAVDIGGSGRAEHRIAATFQELQVAFQHSLRAGGIAFVIDPGRRLGAQHRIAVPARRGELGGEQVQLVFQVRSAGIRLEDELRILDLEVEADLAPC